MATDLEKLVVQLSTDFRDFQKGMAQMAGITNREFRKIEDRARQMNRNLDRIGRSSARSLVAPFMGISAALGGRELIRMTGLWTDLNSRLANAVGPREAASTMDRLSEMARRTYSSLEQTTEGFLSFSTTLTELGYRTGQQLDFVESLNNALVVSGARGDVAARVMEALSKAMALGTLQGDNLNTVISSGGRVAQALAESMGVTTLELRRLGREGRIGRAEMMGITSQLARLREEAGRMPGTIQDGFLLLNNALLEYIGRGDDAVGISGRIADALTMIADNFDTVADAGLQVAAVIAGALVGRSMLGLSRTAWQGSAALVALTRALTQARTASAALAAFAMCPEGAGARQHSCGRADPTMRPIMTLPKPEQLMVFLPPVAALPHAYPPQEQEVYMAVYHHTRIPDGVWRWRYFTPAEIACRGTGTVMLTGESMAALDRLDALRDRMGHPLNVTSGYRSPEHNRAVGGAAQSLHMRGIAFDISMANVDPHRFEREARALGFNGIGLYPPQKPYGARNFIHIDTRPAPGWRGVQWGEFPTRATRFEPEAAPAPVRDAVRDTAPVIGVGGLIEGALAAAEPAMRGAAPWLPEDLRGRVILAAIGIGLALAAWRLWQRRRAAE